MLVEDAPRQLGWHIPSEQFFDAFLYTWGELICKLFVPTANPPFGSQNFTDTEWVFQPRRVPIFLFPVDGLFSLRRRHDWVKALNLYSIGRPSDGRRMQMQEALCFECVGYDPDLFGIAACSASEKQDAEKQILERVGSMLF